MTLPPLHRAILNGGGHQATGPDGKRLHTVAEIAAAVGVHRTTVYDYLNREG